MLRDIATLTGGQVISEELGKKLEDADAGRPGPGAARRRRPRTTRPSSRAAASRTTSRAASARSRSRSTRPPATTTSEKLQERLAKLSGGVAVIKVGAATEVELKEKKARVEDALHATRAAVEEGIVPGGGVTLLRAAPAVDALKLDGDQKVGAEILQARARGAGAPARAQRRPRRQRGRRAPEPREAHQLGLRRHVARSYVDLVKAGIIDPAKVTRSALENAASVAGMILTTEALVTDMPEKKSAAPPCRAAAADMYD